MALNKKEVKKTKEELKKELHIYIGETIKRLVKPPIDYGKEYRTFKVLIKRYPEYKKIFSNISFQVRSLIFFLTPKGKEEIQKIVNMISYEVKEKEKVEMSETKIGENAVIDKPLSVKEFLEKYK